MIAVLLDKRLFSTKSSGKEVSTLRSGNLAANITSSLENLVFLCHKPISQLHSEEHPDPILHCELLKVPNYWKFIF